MLSLCCVYWQVKRIWAKHKNEIVNYVLPSVGGMTVVFVVWFVLFGRSQNGSTIPISTDATASAGVVSAGSTDGAETAAEPAAPTEVAIYVAGAVNSPGVYRLQTNELVGDAIAAAGGFSSECDQSLAEQSLNLAQPLTEGMKIYVPRVGDVISAVPVQDSGDSASSTSSNPGKTSINTASKSDLMDLNGIGEVYSQKIIDSRPYTSLDELTTKKIIPNATYEKIKEEITL